MNDNKIEKLCSDNEDNWLSKYSLFVGRIDGVPVYINFSSAFVFILIAWTLSSTILPNNYPGLVPIDLYNNRNSMCINFTIFNFAS